MTINKFFELLSEFYGEIPDTGYACKFYAQAYSFSYEIHDRSKTCFTDNSLVSHSKRIYSYWSDEDDYERRNEIISDILKDAKLAMTKKALKDVIENKYIKI